METQWQKNDYTILGILPVKSMRCTELLCQKGINSTVFAYEGGCRWCQPPARFCPIDTLMIAVTRSKIERGA
jgi:hypothetical protein